jgi:flotillin
MDLLTILASAPTGFESTLILVAVFVAVLFVTLILIARMYKRCPSDRILVIYGKVAGNKSSHCIHGGGAFVVPLIQDYAFISLTPMTISIPLQNALSFQNIRINVPSTFTVGVSTDPAVMVNAAERLLGLVPSQIEDMAKEIIFGQLRLTVASLTIEQINQDRESFLVEIRKNVEPELNKIGLNLINVNITDITDESTYIESIGKKAAAEAINKAKIDVAQETKLGNIGESDNAREMTVKVAENTAGAEKGKKQAEAGQRIFIAEQEAAAVVGEAAATRDREIKVMENFAQQEKGKMHAIADQRIYVAQQEASAVDGENTSKANIADSNAQLAVRQAEAQQKAEVAKRAAEVEIQKAQYAAELERLKAAEITQKEIERQKILIAAQAEADRVRKLAEGEADRIRSLAKGEADGVLLKYQAEAEGVRKLLDSKAEGYRQLIAGAGGDAKSAATMLMIEKLEDIVKRQTEAIANLKIDKVTVWDSANGDKGSSTAGFISSLMKSLPPIQDVAAMAGVELPAFLGKLKTVAPETQPAKEAGTEKDSKES